MTKFGLRGWVLTLTLAPTILIGILLGGYFTLQRYQEVMDHLQDQGLAIIEPLTIASEQGLALEDREHLKRLVSAVHRRHANIVRNIAIYGRDNKPLVSSTFHRDFAKMRLADGQPIPQVPAFEKHGELLLLRAPVIADTSFYSSYRDRIDPDDPLLGYVSVQLIPDATVLEQHDALFSAILIIFVGVGIHLLFTWRLLKHVTDPITSMVSAVDRIREGKLDTRVQGTLLGELDILKNGINAMAKSLDEYHADMQHNIDQATYDLRMTLEQIEIQNIEMDKARKRAQQASQVKSEFLANMSHELRTPLNGVLGFTRQLMKTQLTPSQSDYLVTIERSAQHLLAIINDILDFSKLESGKLVLDEHPYSFHDLVSDVAEMLGGNARDKGLEMSLTLPQDTPDALVGDGLRLKQVLTNLIGNAVKFTQEGGVEISVNHGQYDQGGREFLRILVSDTGVGISPEQQRSLFQAFSQADASISRRYGGTGLGLVISRTLIEQMGGEIGLESESGKGSTFWVQLPIKHADMSFHDPLDLAPLKDKTLVLLHPSERTRKLMTTLVGHWPITLKSSDDASLLPQGDYLLLDQIESYGDQLDAILATVPEQQKVIALCNHPDPVVREQLLANHVSVCLIKPLLVPRLYQALTDQEPEKPRQQLAPPQLAPVPAVGQGLLPKILVVDDNAPNLKLMEALLTELGCHVSCADDGHKAVALAGQQAFDLIFMDIQMPGMDGVTATGHIRSQLADKAPPIIAVTAHAMAGEKEKLLAGGMDDYLTKPIDELTLKALLNKWLRPKGNPVLDWEQALTQAGGREQLAREMLAMLLDSLPGARAAIETALAEGRDDELLAQIHKLNGALAYTGAKTMKQLGLGIETALKQGQRGQEVEPEVFELLDEMDKLFDVATEQGLAS
ncbi:two-component sensor histidine kinase BarA [Gallaecimonas sp. GXIMD4217]|uniref:two-component sensor histidine kinase BarA n=1 Tax=Gallaecimonas sp. GXIMD4217 TaxID=3131927 RepID=UPI00311AE0E7